MIVTCLTCGCDFDKKVGEINRSPTKRFFCTMECAGKARRRDIDPDEQRKSKSAYDKARRKKMGAELLAMKRASYRRNYDPDKAREKRAARPPTDYEKRMAHMATPEYKAAKKTYDEELRAAEYGEFSECYRLLIALDRTIREKEPCWYHRARERGYYERTNVQRRKRHAQADRP